MSADQIPASPPGSDTVNGFVEVLRQQKLLPDARFDELARILQHRYPTSALLAKELVRRGWLTVYQVNELFRASGRQLVWGPYRILEPLGRGGVSEVFKAWHAERGCLVALKVIHAHWLDHPEALARFGRELRAVSRLAHPNIVQAFDDPVEETRFFAMEFIEGSDLDKLVQLSGLLTPDQACNYASQAALGLQHAYEQGVVHRDIKPSNLVLTADRTLVKVLDFGVARLLEQGGVAGRLTVKGTVIGTPDYVAPEQILDAPTADRRADIYSLGCTLYYLLTGQPPFPTGSKMQKLHDHIKKEPPAVSAVRADVPEALARVVAKMMAKQREDRFQEPGEAAEALQRFAAEAKPLPPPSEVDSH